MLNQNGGSRTDTLVKLVLVFFLSLLSFSVGTFVGKQFSDSQHKQVSLAVEEDERSPASIDPESTKQQPSSVLSEEEIAKLENEFLQKDSKEEKEPLKETTESNVATHEEEKGTAEEAEKHVQTESFETAGAKPVEVAHHDDLIQKKNEPTEVKKEVKAEEATVHDERLKIAQAVAKGEKLEKPATPKKENRFPSSLPQNLAGSSIGKFTLQVSSHSSEDEAKTKAQELVSKGLKAFYLPAEIPGRGTWYRVSVGQFGSRQEAIAEKARVAAEVGLKDTIVQKIQK